MTIRQATPGDLEALLGLCGHFLRATRYAAVLRDVPACQANVLRYLLDTEGCFVLEVHGQVVGLLGFGIVPVPWTGDLTAHECIWWVDPDHRRGRVALAMLDEAETWARESGACSIQMIEPVGNEGLAHLYARRGYVPLERTWHKGLEGGSDGVRTE